MSYAKPASVALALLASLSLSCQTESERRGARTASTFNILFGQKKVQAGSEDLRQQLRRVRGRLSGLDLRAQQALATLQRAQGNRTESAGREAASAQQRQAMTNRLAEARAVERDLRERIARAKGELQRLEGDSADLATEQSLNQARRQAIEVEIESLETQVAFLERTTRQIVRDAAAQAARE